MVAHQRCDSDGLFWQFLFDLSFCRAPEVLETSRHGLMNKDLLRIIVSSLISRVGGPVECDADDEDFPCQLLFDLSVGK